MAPRERLRQRNLSVVPEAGARRFSKSACPSFARGRPSLVDDACHEGAWIGFIVSRARAEGSGELFEGRLERVEGDDRFDVFVIDILDELFVPHEETSAHGAADERGAYGASTALPMGMHALVHIFLAEFDGRADVGT